VTDAYAPDMGMARRGRVEPLPAAPELDHYQGLWVAVKDGEVITAAETSSELVFRLQKLGAKGKGAVMQRAPKRTDAVVIGMG
jgi:hypothetical protein